MTRRPNRRTLAAALATLLAWGLAIGPAAPATAAPSPDVPALERRPPIRDLQWYLNALKIPEAHKLTRGKGVIVGLIDNGVYAQHRDLQGQILAGTGFGAMAGSDGRTDTDAKGHGTMMAGLIVAKGGGTDHALGIAPEAKVLPVGVGVPNTTPETVSSAIRWAVDHGADVISLSFGSSGEAGRATLTAAIRYALDHDVVVVAAAGNTGDPGATSDSDVDLPADVPGVIAVAASDKGANHLPTSVHGPEVVLTAPGEELASTATPNFAESGYGFTGETSGATAIVAGVVALVRARYPDLDAPNVVNRLIATAKDQGDSGRDPYYGFGTVRPLDALTAAVPAVEGWPLATPAAGGDGGPDGGEAGADGESGGGLPRAAWILGGGCLLVVLVVVAVLAATGRQRRRT